MSSLTYFSLQILVTLRLCLLPSLGDEAQAVRELRDLLEVYVQLRPRVIDSMGKPMIRRLYSTD